MGTWDGATQLGAVPHAKTAVEGHSVNDLPAFAGCGSLSR